MIPSQFILLSSFVRHYQLYIKVSTRKIFFRNLSVENFGRIGGDQLSGEVELTIGDELTGKGTRLIKRRTEPAMPVYINRLLTWLTEALSCIATV